MLAWLSVCSEVQTCIWPSWCHCHSLSLALVKSRLVLPFWYRLTQVVLEKRPLNGCCSNEYTNQARSDLWSVAVWCSITKLTKHPTLEGNFSNYAQRNLETSHMAGGIFQGKEFNMILTSHHLGHCSQWWKQRYHAISGKWAILLLHTAQ